MTRMLVKTSIVSLVLLGSSNALAQAADASAAASTDGTADARAGMALPGQDAPAGASDHSQVVGHLAVGFLGRRTMSIADPGTGAPTPVGAPIVGVRYWINPMLGIDAGLGLSMTSGSISAGGQEVDKVGTTVFMIHAGVPLSLASSQHFSFQIVPEVNLGLASATEELDPAPDNELSGFHLGVGARAGAELHFGFIDVPQLSLQGGVGLALVMDNTSASNQSSSDPAQEYEDKTTSFGTTLAGNPWDIFTGNISALYYF